MVRIFLIVLLLVVAYPAYSMLGGSFATGYGAANIVPLRFGLLKQWDASFCGYWEGSFYHMRGRREELNAYAIAGVFRFIKNRVYFDLGIGGSYLSKKKIGGRKLGMHFQFEDRAGIGVLLGDKKQFEMGYRALHFSNGYLAKYNHGINLHLLVLTYWFV